jgi:hypothetical protein
MLAMLVGLDARRGDLGGTGGGCVSYIAVAMASLGVRFSRQARIDEM